MTVEIHPLFFMVVPIVFAGAGLYLGAYLKKRGENLATKEDIGQITEKIEGVRAQFAADLEQRKAYHSLRTACLDKRLVAHQEAYAHWIKLARNMHQPETANHVQVCQEWWDKNCLFLDPKPRQAFLEAFRSASIHSDYLKSGQVTIVNENWDRIIGTGPALEEAVGLPSIKSIIEEFEKVEPAKAH